MTLSTTPMVPPKIRPKPWGHEDVFADYPEFTFKLLHIEAGKRTSLQLHRTKLEMLMVVKGTVSFWSPLQGERELEPGDWVAIKPYVPHRIEALGEGEAWLTEMAMPGQQDGDLVRVEDDYGRADGTAR